jgi:beta-glucosidase
LTDFLSFPDGFVWGTATASYQIEGAFQSDGKGESIWDRFAHTPGKIENGDTGDVACGHYDRLEEDLGLLKQLGVKAYRFSIAWPRILPEGRGTVNPKGLDFYNRLVDGLLEVGITPFATLYHWDMPQTLQDAGGWTERSITEAFVEYADVISQALGDRVKHWMTVNEPAVSAWNGHLSGNHAPGLKDPQAAIRAAHHLMLSHGLAVPVLRQNSSDSEVGIVLNSSWVVPASNSRADRESSRFSEGLYVRWFSDPVFGFGYPVDMVTDFVEKGFLESTDMPWVQPGDLKTISIPVDFLGINYYARHVHRDEQAADNLPRTVFEAPRDNLHWTEMGWEIYPQGIFNVLTRMALEYKIPKLYITENGCSFSDGPGPDGQVHDERRVDYLQSHIAACQRAIQAGIPLSGYFVWSFLDNFEWAHGFSQRFGLVHVDYQSLERTPKDSYHWYANVCRQNNLTMD